jgi:hypothetical protein
MVKLAKVSGVVVKVPPGIVIALPFGNAGVPNTKLDDDDTDKVPNVLAIGALAA